MFGKLLPALFLFLSLYLFPPRVLGVTIVIKAHPQQVLVLEEFEVVADVVELEGNTVYQAKAVGGENNRDLQTYSIKTGSYLSWNAKWNEWPNDFPEFTTNASGSATISLKTRYKEEAKIGISNLSITIKKKEVDQPHFSDIKTITVNPAPTSTPQPTKTPTLTPTQTPTKTPTPRPATSTPKPTSTPQANIITTNDSTNVLSSVNSGNNPEILGESTNLPISPSPTNIQENAPKVLGVSTGAKVSLIIGLLFLGTAIMIFTRESIHQKSKST